MNRATLPSMATAALLLVIPQTALASIGPGAGISAIGTVVALLGAIALLLVGFVWYPIKRLRRKLREARSRNGTGTPA